MNRLDRFFEISARESTVAAEVRGGLVTFIAMAYIIVLNPIILSSAEMSPAHKLEFDQVSAMTSLTAGVMTILFGLIARLPFAFAAGLGINSFLATTVVGSLTWPEAMGLVVINGLIIVLLAATGLRRLVFDAVPMQLKLAITAGIGLFILFIGLVDAGFVGSTGHAVAAGRPRRRRHRFDQHRPHGRLRVHPAADRHPRRAAGARRHPHRACRGHPRRGRHRGDLAPRARRSSDPAAGACRCRRCRDRRSRCPTCRSSASSACRQLRPHRRARRDHARVHAGVRELLRRDGHLHRVWRARPGSPTTQGTFPRLRSALIVEGAGAVVGGATSSSSNTVFIESGAGIEEGARTGLANLVTGVLFLAAMFVSPLASIVPTEVAAAALVIVGAMMVSQLRHIDISEFSVALPVVLTVAVMPFSYSIANGIGVGFIAWVVLRSAAGKAREISPLLWIVAAGFVVYFARGWIESLIGM